MISSVNPGAMAGAPPRSVVAIQLADERNVSHRIVESSEPK